MKHLALYRKWRPQRFGELVGQDHVSRTLLNSIRQDRLAHAYLFCGPRGTGKTSSARLLAKALNCLDSQQGEPCNVCANCEEITAGHSLDVIEIDAASNRGIDSARDLREQVRFSASGGRYRVFIIDEFHMLTKEAFNALLKTLEEPPEKVIFVLATTEPHEILQTVVSRCQRFDFQRISTRALADHLQHVAAAEQIGVSPAALEAMARKANGGLRDGLSLLDQVRAMGLPGETLPDSLVYQTLGLVQEEELLAILTAAFNAEPETMLANLRLLLEQGHDSLQILAELIQLLRHLSLASLPPERLEQLGVPSHLIEAVIALGRQLSRGQIVSALELLLRTSDRLHHCAQPDIWLEADLICLCLQAERSLVHRLEALEQGAPRAPQRPEVRQEVRPEPRAESRPEPRPEQRVEPSFTPRVEPVSPPVAAPPAADPAPTSYVEPVWMTEEQAPVRDFQDLSGLWRAFLERVKETQRPLIGFLLNGKLVVVSRERKLWILEFNSRTHCERVRDRLKNGKLQALASEIMGEPYGIEARLPDETEKKTIDPGTERPEPVAPPAVAPVSQPVMPPAAAQSPARAERPQPVQERMPARVQEHTASYESSGYDPAPAPFVPAAARFEDDIDMDYLPEPDATPYQSAAPRQPESQAFEARPPERRQTDAAQEPQPGAVATRERGQTRAPERERQPRIPESERSPEPVQERVPVEAVKASEPLSGTAQTLDSLEAFADEPALPPRHGVQDVADLFKGKIIHRRS